MHALYCQRDPGMLRMLWGFMGLQRLLLLTGNLHFTPSCTITSGDATKFSCTISPVAKDVADGSVQHMHIGGLTPVIRC